MLSGARKSASASAVLAMSLWLLFLTTVNADVAEKRPNEPG
jgi:hypothetical protein